MYSPFIGFEHQRRLHPRGRRFLLNRLNRGGVHCTQPARGVGVLVGVVIARYPERLVVAGQVELRQLVLHRKIGQLGLRRHLVAKAHAVGKHPKYDIEPAPRRGRLLQMHRQLLVVVADAFHLAPHRLPAFVHVLGFAAPHHQRPVKARPFRQCQPQPRGQQHRL